MVHETFDQQTYTVQGTYVDRIQGASDEQKSVNQMTHAYFNWKTIVKRLLL